MAAYAAAIWTEALQFTIWDQIRAFGRPRFSQLDWLGNVHASRYAVVKALAFEPASSLGISEDLAFSCVVGLCMVMQAFVIARVCRLASNRRHAAPWLTVWFLALSEATSLLMNGRLAFGFLGQSLLLLFQVGWVCGLRPRWLLALLILPALVLSTVSSGVFSSALCSVVLWGVLLLWTSWRTLSRSLRALAILLTAGAAGISYPMARRFYEKNSSFYADEGFSAAINLLKHGVAEKLPLEDPLVLVGLIAAILLSLGLIGIGLYAVVHRKPAWWALGTSIMSASVLGCYGWSTLLSGLPPALVLGTLLFRREPGASKVGQPYGPHLTWNFSR